MNDATFCRESRPAAGSLVSPKITREHLRRRAVLYVRQSTSQQLRDHRESTARQYQLVDRLLALGWSREQVVVIDEDLGISGSGQSDRPGFRRMLQLVSDQQTGLVLGLEMSRLARNSKDWHDLFEVCGIFNTLIADEDGVFDPHDLNDRLLLGLKGIMSEMELHLMQARLERGRFNKAQRGEMFHDVPVGYVLNAAGLPELDPDASARRAMETFFQLFETLGSSHGVYQHLERHGIRLPFRDHGGPIDWRIPAVTTVYGLLKHPLYAGTYGYARQKKYQGKRREKSRRKHLPPEQWKVLLKDRYPAYITWDQYLANQRRLSENDCRPDRSGPVRGGEALLAGVVFCGRCGRRMSPHYHSGGGASYCCGRHYSMASKPSCGCVLTCPPLDRFVTEKILEALAPSAVELSLRACEDEVTRRAHEERRHLDQVEQARYAADLCQRRHQQIDPANRLVAATLEQDWELALAELQAARQRLEDYRAIRPLKLDADERRQLLESCANLAALWREGATNAQRQQLARLLLERVEVQVQGRSDRVSVLLRWSGGFVSSHEIIRPVQSFEQQDHYAELLRRITELGLAGKSTRQIAEVLNAEGYRSPRHGSRFSGSMVYELCQTPACLARFEDPVLEPDQWRSADLAKELGIPEKRLKDWVTRGWATAVQRPHGRTWVIYASAGELHRLRRLAIRQTGQGTPAPPEQLRTPAQLPPRKP